MANKQAIKQSTNQPINQPTTQQSNQAHAPALEALEIVKDVGEEKVEEGPEFREVVLEGSSGEKKAVGGGVGLELADEAAVEVLEAVALIDDDVLPAEALEVLAVIHDNLVGGDDDREGAVERLEALAADLAALIDGAVVQHNVHGRHKAAGSSQKSKQKQRKRTVETR